MATLATVGSLGINISATVGSLDKALRRARRQLKAFGDWAEKTLKWTVGLGLATGALAIRAFAQQATAENSLRSALQAHGYAVDANMLRYQRLATQLQWTTIYGDEFVMGLMAQGLNLGITAEQIDLVTQQAIGLSHALGINVSEAMKKMAVASKGQFGELGELIPALRAAGTASEKLAIVQDLANMGLLQATDYSDTLLGRWEQLKNAAGDLAEAVGGKLAGALDYSGNLWAWTLTTVRALTLWVQNLNQKQLEIIASWAKWVLGALALMALLPTIIKGIQGLVAALKWLAAAKALNNPLAAIGGIVAAGLVVGTGAYLAKKVGDTADAFGGTWDRAIGQAKAEAEQQAAKASQGLKREDIQKQIALADKQVQLQTALVNQAREGKKPFDYHDPEQAKSTRKFDIHGNRL